MNMGEFVLLKATIGLFHVFKATISMTLHD